MALALFIVFGLVIGLIARAMMPGDQKMGLPMAIAMGVAGSFVGGFLVYMVTGTKVTDFLAAGVVGSLVGALILLFVAGVLRRRNEISQ